MVPINKLCLGPSDISNHGMIELTEFEFLLFLEWSHQTHPRLMKKLILIIAAINLLGCTYSSEPNQFNLCTDALAHCDLFGEYCLSGFKWGNQNEFENGGIEATGPQIAGGLVSYSFQESPTFVSNHLQLDVPTMSFDALLSCAKDNIRSAFEAWSGVANIQFEELTDDSNSDIKFYIAEVTTCGNGFPNYQFSPCNEISGQITLSPHVTQDCSVFEAYVLHEIGHALGLGHSSPDNIMGLISDQLGGIQEGDIKGIQQIYGE